MKHRDKINKTPEVEKAYSELNKVKVRQIFLHRETRHEITFDGLILAEFRGEWYDAVVYYHEHNSIPRPLYCSSTLDFLEHFEILKGQYSYN